MAPLDSSPPTEAPPDSPVGGLPVGLQLDPRLLTDGMDLGLSWPQPDFSDSLCLPPWAVSSREHGWSLVLLPLVDPTPSTAQHLGGASEVPAE